MYMYIYEDICINMHRYIIYIYIICGSLKKLNSQIMKSF